MDVDTTTHTDPVNEDAFLGRRVPATRGRIGSAEPHRWAGCGGEPRRTTRSVAGSALTERSNAGVVEQPIMCFEADRGACGPARQNSGDFGVLVGRPRRGAAPTRPG